MTKFRIIISSILGGGCLSTDIYESAVSTKNKLINISWNALTTRNFLHSEKNEKFIFTKNIS